MIWHDYILINLNIEAMLEFLNLCFADTPKWAEQSPAPTNAFAKLTVSCAVGRLSGGFVRSRQKDRCFSPVRRFFAEKAGFCENMVDAAGNFVRK